MLKIYDKFETDFSTNGIAILENATNIKIKEVINGEYTLSFSVPRNNAKWQYIQPENFVKANDQLFRVKTFKETRDEQGKTISNIQCEHVWYDANNCKFIPNAELIGYTPRQILEYAFADTMFTISTVDITTPTDIFLSKTNPAKIINKLIENVDGEIIRDNYTIHFVKRRGNNSNVQFRFGKNIKSLEKTTDTTSLTTRLFPYGKDDLDISSVNSGVSYVDSPLKDNYDRLHINHMDYKDIEDPTGLMEKAIQEFSTEEIDGIDKPKITYSIDIVELKKLSDYGNLEAFSIGDTIRVFDEDLGIDTNQRIVEYEFYPYEPMKSKVVLINYGIKQKNDLSKFLTNLSTATQDFENIKTYTGVLDPRFIENIREKLHTEINEVQEKALLHEFGDIYVDDPNNPTKALLLGAGIFAIANSKKENGDWNWRTIATGDRVVADEVDANWVYTGGIHANQIVAGEIIADAVKSTWVYAGKLNVQHAIIGKGDSVGSLNLEIGENNYVSFRVASTINGNTLLVGKVINPGDIPSKLERVDFMAGTLYIYDNLFVNSKLNGVAIANYLKSQNIEIIDYLDFTTLSFFGNETFMYSAIDEKIYGLGNHDYQLCNITNTVKHLTQAEALAKTDWLPNQLVEITDELPIITDNLTSSSTTEEITNKINSIIQALDGWMLRRA